MQCRRPDLRACERAAWPLRGLLASCSPPVPLPGSRRPRGPRRVSERARGCGAAAARSRQPLPGPGAERAFSPAGPLGARCARSAAGALPARRPRAPVGPRAAPPARPLATPPRSRRRGPRDAPVPLSFSLSGGLLSLPESFKVAMAFFCVSRGGSASPEGRGGW